MDIDRPPDIVVIAGGAPVEPGLVATVDDSTRVVAADAGVALAGALGWQVDVAVGDFDSLHPEMVAGLDAIAGEVRRYPPAKDATDLELALEVAAETGSARVLVVGIEGGRPDHALANLLVASSDRFAAVEVELVLEGGRAWIVHDDLRGALPPGSTVSLIAVHGDATVSLSGVRWPLTDDVLASGSTRGVSNEVADGSFALDVHAGTVICIVPRTQEIHP